MATPFNLTILILVYCRVRLCPISANLRLKPDKERELSRKRFKGIKKVSFFRRFTKISYRRAESLVLKQNWY